MQKLDINPQKLYEGCIFAAVAHAVMVGEYPEFNYEHSWDGINYCMNNTEGCHATITFGEKYIVAVFQDITVGVPYRDALDYFEGAQKEIIELAQSEALQYVLEDIRGETKPFITAAFWGTWEELYSTQDFHTIMKNGGHIISAQLMDELSAFRAWDDYYGMNDGQMKLIETLSKRRVQNSFYVTLTLDKAEASNLVGDIDECKVSLKELNIVLEDSPKNQ